MRKALVFLVVVTLGVLAACSSRGGGEWQQVLVADQAAAEAVTALNGAAPTAEVIRKCTESAQLAKNYALAHPGDEHAHQAVEIFVSRQEVLQKSGDAEALRGEELLRLTDLPAWLRENIESPAILARQKALIARWPQDRAGADSALREQIATVAQKYPQGKLAGSLADELEKLLRDSDPEAAERLWPELAASPAEALRTHATSRLALQEAKRAPTDIAFTAIDGRKVDLKALRGKVVLVVFAGVTWCAPCREEEAHLKELYARYGRDDLEIIGVSWEYTPESRDKVASLLAQRQIPWPYYFDGQGERNPFLLRFGIKAVPNTFLFDRAGLLIESGLEGEHLLEETAALMEGGRYHDLVFAFRRDPEYMRLDAQYTRLAKVADTLGPQERQELLRTVARREEIAQRHLQGIVESRHPALAKMTALKHLSDTERYDGKKRLRMLQAYEAELGPVTELVDYRRSIERDLQMQEAAKRMVVGARYEPVTAHDLQGKAVVLADVLAANQYVLLDLWASWCAPCRAEFPHLKQVYERYRERGFAVYSVSIDADRSAWLKALKEEQLPWLNLSSPGDFESPVAAAYGVGGIPAAFLIARDGTIKAAFTPGARAETQWTNLEPLLQKLLPRS